MTSSLRRYFSPRAQGAAGSLQKHCKVWHPMWDGLYSVGKRGGGTKKPPRRIQEYSKSTDTQKEIGDKTHIARDRAAAAAQTPRNTFLF